MRSDTGKINRRSVFLSIPECVCFEIYIRWWGREVGLAGVGWRDGEKMQTTIIE